MVRSSRVQRMKVNLIFFALWAHALSSLAETTNNQSATCGANEFQCENGTCISVTKRCDGSLDCKDKDTDEKNCAGLPHPGGCVFPPYPDNGTYTLHRSDDNLYLNIKCNKGYQVTGYSLIGCVEGAWDREIPECITRVTTVRNQTRPCSADEFTCKHGSCVNHIARCDGKADCDDGSDEDQCEGVPKPNKCVLPPYQPHGKYTVRIDPNAAPGSVYDSVHVSFSCDKDYVMVDISLAFCWKGKWYQDLPRCTKRLCKLDPHPSVKYYCKVPGSANRTRICNENEVTGTRVQPECNGPIYYSPKPLPKMTCFDGKWSEVVTCASAATPLLADSSKKETERCSSSEIKCSDGKCLSFDLLCDGKNDCPDGSDEAVCEATPRTKRCILPAYPAHGTYTVDNGNLTDVVPGQDFDSLQLTVTCDAEYQVKRPNTVFCLTGVWYGSMPQCKRYCKLDRHPSVLYRCLVPGSKDTRICDAYEPSGTVVQTECNAPNYYSPYALPSMRCVNGSWNEIVTCIPECGRVAPQGEPLTIGGRPAKKAEMPWHAGIVSRDIPGAYYISCAGTIVSTTVVISAASCFWYNGVLTVDYLYSVAVGTQYRLWRITLDEDSQLSDVIDVHVPQHFKRNTLTRQANIAMVLVATPFVYTIYVRPICLSFDSDFESRQLSPGNKGKMAGWGFTTESGEWADVLQVVELPYVDVDQCYEVSAPNLAGLVTSDKFCAGYTNGTASTCHGDTGGGLVFPDTEQGVKRYYLRGVLSEELDRNNTMKCNANVLSLFTNILNHEHFIKKDLATGFCKLTRHPSVHYRCLVPGTVNDTRICNNYEPSGTVVQAECNAPEYHSTYTLLPMTCTNGRWNTIVTCTPVANAIANSGACVMPPDPEHGVYKVNNAPDAVPGQTFDYLHLNLTCYNGFGVVGPDYVVCVDGVWLGSIPKCQRFCKLDNHPSVNYQCLVTGSVVGTRRCNTYEPSGTVVRPECNAPNYYSTYSPPSMTCSDGLWNEIFTCLPECGRVTPGGKELVVGGRRAKKGELPWHAGIYSKTFKPYKQICGGSLVRNNVVISAAHCFWTDFEKQQPASAFAVAVGKLFRPWQVEQDEEAQYSDVSAIHLPPHFQGGTTNFQDDIAIVVTSTPFEYKTHVRPVCLNFNINFERWQLQPGSMGKVAGWGLTAANKGASVVLLVTKMPYVDVNQCYRISSFAFQQYITSDKICAGNNGSTLCEGDSGGGLAFSELEQGKERYYLRGIVSTAPAPDGQDKCNERALITFTNVLKHDPFIQNYL